MKNIVTESWTLESLSGRMKSSLPTISDSLHLIRFRFPLNCFTNLNNNIAFHTLLLVIVLETNPFSVERTLFLRKCT
jgi:hypothetical protein